MCISLTHTPCPSGRESTLHTKAYTYRTLKGCNVPIFWVYTASFSWDTTQIGPAHNLYSISNVSFSQIHTTAHLRYVYADANWKQYRNSYITSRPRFKAFLKDQHIYRYLHVHVCTYIYMQRVCLKCYGVAMISRLLKIIGRFCRICSCL